MKEQIQNEILREMGNVLNYQQLEVLQGVIKNCFRNKTVSLSNKDTHTDEEDNERLLQLFISAKKVEGCSEKSLKYYSTTIEALFYN
ncbi:MAG: hypothetical protein QM727_05580 [Niabella sp.]